MARKFLSVREADLKRQLESLDPARAGEIDRRAMIVSHENHQKRHSIGAYMVRLRDAFNAKARVVTRARAESDHAAPDAEHPTLAQWRTFLISEDFTAFVCYCLRIDVADKVPSLDVARWLESLRPVTDADTHVLAGMFKSCIRAAIDEWNQDQLYGKRELPPEDVTLIEDLEAVVDLLCAFPVENVNNIAV